MSGGGVEVTIRKEFRAGILKLARPPVNALDADGYEAGSEALERLNADADVGAIVLTGEGSRSFCAGTDLATFSRPDEFGRVAAAAARFFDALASSSVPLVGALNGPAVGGGVMIASECDVLVAIEDVYFVLPELSHGLIGGGSHLRRIAPYFKAMRMLLLGERLTVAEAHASGVVESVVGADQLLDRALAVAAELSGLESAPMRAARNIFRGMESDLASAGYARERQILRELVAARQDK
jgi:enoyl-CoA hydratase/carnithine racemase